MDGDSRDVDTGRALGGLSLRLARRLPFPIARRIAARRRRRSFALVHSGRCGSTVLLDLLRQNTAIHADGEILAHYDRASAPRGPLEQLERARARAFAPFYCFSTKTTRWDDLRPEKVGMALAEYVRGLVAMGFDAFVVIQRRNFLAQTVSGIVARERDAWHTTLAPRDVLRVRVPVDGGRDGSLYQGMLHLDAMYGELARLLAGQASLALTYEEDVLPDPASAYERVCALVGAPPGEVRVRLQQTNPFALRDVIENMDEVSALLAGTPYAWMTEAGSDPVTRPDETGSCAGVMEPRRPPA